MTRIRFQGEGLAGFTRTKLLPGRPVVLEGTAGGKWRLVWEIVTQGGADRDLKGANLYAADLCGAKLGSANLHEANLRATHLNGANLEGANLSKATVTLERLPHTDSLKGAVIPHETEHV